MFLVSLRQYSGCCCCCTLCLYCIWYYIVWLLNFFYLLLFGLLLLLIWAWTLDLFYNCIFFELFLSSIPNGTYFNFKTFLPMKKKKTLPSFYLLWTDQITIDWVISPWQRLTQLASYSKQVLTNTSITLLPQITRVCSS